MCPHSLVDEMGLSSLVVYRFFPGSLKPHWGLVYRGILDLAGRLPRVVPPFVSMRDGAIFVDLKPYSGLVYRGITDPTRRPTVFVVIIGSSFN